MEMTVKTQRLGSEDNSETKVENVLLGSKHDNGDLAQRIGNDSGEERRQHWYWGLETKLKT